MTETKMNADAIYAGMVAARDFAKSSEGAAMLDSQAYETLSSYCAEAMARRLTPAAAEEIFPGADASVYLGFLLGSMAASGERIGGFVRLDNEIGHAVRRFINGAPAMSETWLTETEFGRAVSAQMDEFLFTEAEKLRACALQAEAFDEICKNAEATDSGISGSDIGWSWHEAYKRVAIERGDADTFHVEGLNTSPVSPEDKAEAAAFIGGMSKD